MKLAVIAIVAGLSVAPVAFAYDPPPIPNPQQEEAASQGDPDSLLARYGSDNSIGTIMTLGLCLAIEEKNSRDVARFLALGAKPNRLAPPFDAYNALGLAIDSGEARIAAQLVVKGANPVDVKLDPFKNLPFKPPAGAHTSMEGIVMADFHSVVKSAEDHVMAKATAENDAKIDADLANQKNADDLARKAREASDAASLREQAEEERKENARQDAIETNRIKAQLKIWHAFIQSVKANQYRQAKAEYSKLDLDILDQADSDSREALDTNIGSHIGKHAFLFAEYDSPVPGGALIVLRGSGDRVFLSGVREGQFITGEDFDMVATIDGTYTYTSVLGSRVTVPRLALDMRF